MKARRSLMAWAIAFATALPTWLDARDARANGRMPGATELAIDRADPKHILARATFGLVQSFDRGTNWQWICEQAINVSGEADPPMAAMAGGTLVLLPPTGGALVSQDQGCSWSPAPDPLPGQKAVDLTLDPNDPAHLLVIMSTIADIDSKGIATFTNILAETRDSAKTWVTLSMLASDFGVETIEIGASDPQRIYVSGEANTDPRLGIIERSDDGGKSWVQRTTLVLPEGSGSLLLSAVDPSDADRLWVRVPARGDTLGLFAASLLMSSDKGASWKMLAGTQRAMFGFALSPDGTKLAYGGPTDGLYIGASDGSGEFKKVSGLQVRCLRWSAEGLYVCGSEPSDPFSVGLSTDEGASFQSVYRIADTCPQLCPDATLFATTCEPSWRGISPAIMASIATCSVPWAKPATAKDAGSAAATKLDAGGIDAGGGRAAAPADAGSRDASASAKRPSDKSGCSCRITGSEPHAAHTPMTVVSALAGLRVTRRRLRRACHRDRSRGSPMLAR